MARPVSTPGTLGKNTTSTHPTKPGHVQARGYYRT